MDGPSPLYQDDWTILYQARVEDVLPLIDQRHIALVVADPPYGLDEQPNRGERRRSMAKAPSFNFDPMDWDHVPYDPTPLLRFPRLVLFGANYYADKLPPSPSWIVWDKLNGLATTKKKIGFCDASDVELIWTNLGGPARLLHHRWMGLLKETERRSPRLHPTQKPVAVMAAILDCFTVAGDLVLAPYEGSGPVVIAARKLGRRCIAIECEAQHCRMILERLYAEFPEDHPRAAKALRGPWRPDRERESPGTPDPGVPSVAQA